MDLIQDIISRAKANPQHIVFPEGTEERTLKAADRLLAEGVVRLTLIGDPSAIRSHAQELGLQNIDKRTSSTLRTTKRSRPILTFCWTSAARRDLPKSRLQSSSKIPYTSAV